MFMIFTFMKIINKCYTGSHFLGHAIAEETFQSIQAVHGKLDLTHNLVQVSMDGPNFNWKIVEIIKDYWEHDDPDGPDLIESGSCGLHVPHCAYGTAQKAKDWNLDKLLKAIYSVSKLSLVWREDYLKVIELIESHKSKSVTYLFSQRFCGLRWLENGKVLKRVIEPHSYFKRYFSYLKEKKKIPSKDRFTTILDKMGFPLHLATRELSVILCSEIELFLTFFQEEQPLAVFLYEKWK